MYLDAGFGARAYYQRDPTHSTRSADGKQVCNTATGASRKAYSALPNFSPRVQCRAKQKVTSAVKQQVSILRSGSDSPVHHKSYTETAVHLVAGACCWLELPDHLRYRVTRNLSVHSQRNLCSPKLYRKWHLQVAAGDTEWLCVQSCVGLIQASLSAGRCSCAGLTFYAKPVPRRVLFGLPVTRLPCWSAILTFVNLRVIGRK